MEILNLLIIVCSIVYIWDYSGFIFDLTKWIYTKLNKDKPYRGQSLPKPIGCTLCMIYWTTTIYYYIQIQSDIIYAVGVGVASSILGMLIDKLMMIIIRYIDKIE